jgi:acyl carrier protein
VPLEALPVTTAGKVDRRALPDPTPDEAPGAGFVAPSTASEELLAEIWAEVLGRERIGTTDDFFALGGHSLVATQVVARLAREVGLEVPVRQIFETPVLGELAVELERLLLADAAAEADG